MPNNLCVFALNATVTQLLDIVIKVNAASADNLVEQCGCESGGVIET